MRHRRGPEPLPNGEIDPLESYWYVELKPAPAVPSGPSMSPTAPPLVSDLTSLACPLRDR